MKTLRDYQLQAVQACLERNMLILDEWGLGKTLMGVEAIRQHPRTDLPKLIITRMVSVEHWRAHIEEQAPGSHVEILTVKDAAKIPSLRDTDTWIIMHPEALVKHATLLAKIFFSVIVLDEAHRFKNRKSDRYDALGRLSSLRKIAMTATPLDRAPHDLWAILRWLYPASYRGYFSFVAQHCIQVPGYQGHLKMLPGAKDPEKLARELAPFTLARTKIQVAPSLPPNTISMYALDMTPAQKKVYARIAKEKDVLVFLGDIEGRDPESVDYMFVMNALAKMQKLMQAAVDPNLALEVVSEDWAASNKLTWLDTMLEEHPSEKVLILSQYRSIAERVAARYQIPRITGTRKDKVGSNTPRIVGTIGAAGESLDLPHIQTTIFLDLASSTSQMQQAMNRHHRITITEPKQTILLISKGTIERHILDLVMEKKSAVEVLLNCIRDLRSLSGI